MKAGKLFLFILLTALGLEANAQVKSIKYEQNGRDTVALSNNPFGKYVGEWTLKNDDWTQNWGYGTETIKIPGHHTVTTQLNTDNSLLSIIDGPEPNGQIFWSYNPNTKEVGHLSSFGSIRAGKGNGTVNEKGDVRLKLVFEGEPKNTYRIYNYRWVNEDEYHMKSVQYDADNKPTGLFYEGNFVRIKPGLSLKEEIQAVLSVLDNNDISTDEPITVYTDDVVHMAPDNEVILNQQDLLTYLNQQKTYGRPEMKHEIIEFSQHDDVIIMRGRVKGTFHPANGGEAVAFQTKNLFVFERVNGELKIAKVIYNRSPN